MQKPRILILCSYANSLTHFRGDFIKSLIDNGYTVFGGAPEMPDDIYDDLKKIGAIPLSYSLERTGVNPLRDLRSILELKKLIKTHNIDLLFPYTIKPVIYGSLAANMTKTPTISLITGLGFTFSGTSRKAILLQKVTEFLYKISIRKNKLIIFQNMDDRNLFIKRNIISNKHKFDVVNGSGVNFEKYPYRVNKNTSDKIIFVMVARLIEEKGINLFIKAAEALKPIYPNSEFHVIGAPDKSPSAIDITTLNELHSKNIITYHGRQKNVPGFLYDSDVFVLPTYYREGIPRSILEALSIGMPIITTDSPGCRETIVENKNGLLIEPKSFEALKNAMQYLLENTAEIKNMGIQSRALAENKFDVNLINTKLVSLLKDAM